MIWLKKNYCSDNGRPSMDPVMLIKIPFIQYLYGIKMHAADHERDRGKSLHTAGFLDWTC